MMVVPLLLPQTAEEFQRKTLFSPKKIIDRLVFVQKQPTESIEPVHKETQFDDRLPHP